MYLLHAYLCYNPCYNELSEVQETRKGKRKMWNEFTEMILIASGTFKYIISSYIVSKIRIIPLKTHCLPSRMKYEKNEKLTEKSSNEFTKMRLLATRMFKVVIQSFILSEIFIIPF